MKRHILVKCIAGLMGLGLLAGLAGCEQIDKKKENAEISREKGMYDKESNSLETWKEELEAGVTGEITAESVRGIQTVENGKIVFGISYEPRTYKNSYDCWSLSVPYESWVTVDTEAMYEYFDNIEGLSLEPADISKEDAGLTESNTSFFIAYYSGQGEKNAGQAQPDKGLTYLVGKEADKDHLYVKTDSGDEVWTADKNAVEMLLKPDPYSMILKVANVVSIETVSTMEIQIEGKDYIIDFSEQENGKYKLNKKKAEQEEINELYTAIMSIFIEGEKEDHQETEKNVSPMMSIIYHRNIEEAPEIVETFYEYDDRYAAVNINGTEFFLVEKESVKDLMDTITDAF